jgi:hypothetical protein
MALTFERDAFFIAQDWDDTPGLPHKELMEFKDKLHQLYPSYWKNSPAFEEQWSNCLSSISQACKRQEHRRSPRTNDSEKQHS